LHYGLRADLNSALSNQHLWHALPVRCAECTILAVRELLSGRLEHLGKSAMTTSSISVSLPSQFRLPMVLAMAADALQIFVFPLFAAGALSPADDLLDVAVAAVMVRLLGWHWEFLPAFAAELVPGVDLVPFWTFAVLNVYRKWKQIAVTPEETHGPHPALPKS